MSKINTVHDAETFHPDDNPIVQYKDALAVQGKQETIKDFEDLEKILNESLFRLSVEEFSSFVKFNPLFKNIKNADIHNTMLLISLFSQLSYHHSCLPDIGYKLGNWVKQVNPKIVKNTFVNLSPYITQTRQTYFFAFKSAKLTCLFDTNPINTGHVGLSVEQTKQVMSFYAKHYRINDFSLFDETDQFIASMTKPDELTNQTLMPETNYKLKIDYAVEAKKLPITVYYQLQDCSLKALKFIHKFQNASNRIRSSIGEELFDNLVEFYETNWNNAKLRNPVSVNSIVCAMQNKNSQCLYSKSEIQSARVRNHLLDSLVKIAGNKH